MGSFYVRFSLNLEPNITAACIKNGVKGCVGIVPSVKETVATIIKKKTSSRLILHERVRGLLIATGNDDSAQSILAAGSMAVFELKISGRTYLTFLLLVDVLDMVVGTDGLDAALKEVEVSIIMAVDAAVEDMSLIDTFTNAMKKYDGANGSPDYHETFWRAQAFTVTQENRFSTIELGENKEFSNDGDVSVSKEFESELFTNPISLRIFGVFLLISTFMAWAFLTIKGNCYNNVEMNDGFDSAMGGTTENFAQEDCKSCLSLTNEGIEEVLRLSSKQLNHAFGEQRVNKASIQNINEIHSPSDKQNTEKEFSNDGDVSVSKEFESDANGSQDYNETFWRPQAFTVRQENRSSTVESGEIKEFSNDGDVSVSKEFESELFTNTISLHIFGVFLLISTFMAWAFLTIKGNCYNNVEMNDGFDSAMGGTTENFAQEDCKSCLSLTNEGIEEVLRLSSKQLTTRLENNE
eukprot:CAMPEP_0194346652 /NCGR_PEP_ID=MMETSP0171-20130528/105548_1 /TAXON_ID=218684 /ORGANISM="Corethron pennatum, Strain L29A3" /LENGTH=465 /DNA_ID=CAMNT_0039113807 /DNA_START=215 /DNA_END=1612 /DNA_ORIENTATION=-